MTLSSPGAGLLVILAPDITEIPYLPCELESVRDVGFFGPFSKTRPLP